MVRYTRNRVFEVREKTLKTREKTRLYQAIRSYEKYDKNIIYMPQEQINVFNMHGYEAAWILPDGIIPPDMEIYEQADHRYAAVHIGAPFGNPFVTIPNAYKTLMEYMRVNALEHTEKDVIPCFETDGDSMDIYIACK